MYLNFQHWMIALITEYCNGEKYPLLPLLPRVLLVREASNYGTTILGQASMTASIDFHSLVVSSQGCDCPSLCIQDIGSYPQIAI